MKGRIKEKKREKKEKASSGRVRLALEWAAE